nr:hypothetical protein [uncultured Martelella sp.]
MEGPADLGADFASLNLPAVSDPKLFTLGDEVWAAINTGHFETPNRIFVKRIYPHASRPIECRFDRRGAIEKNWGFFLLNDELFCLYMLNPLTILRCVDRHAEHWEFVAHPDWAPLHNRKLPSLTIGPQPIVTDSASGPIMHVIAHQRFVLLRKRTYLGRALGITLSGTPQITSVGPLLAHSPVSMLGSRIRHNRNLISCTYFSGLRISEGRALLSYGINDTDFNLAETSYEDIGFKKTT